MTSEQILEWMIMFGDGWVANIRADAITQASQRVRARNDGWLLYRSRATDEYMLSPKSIKVLKDMKNDIA